MNKPIIITSFKPVALLVLLLFTLQQFVETLALDSSSVYEGNQTDYMALLGLKSQLIDGPEGVLGSWNNSSPHCSWEGITCDPKNHRVIDLDMNGTLSGGTISPFIGNLTFLTRLKLRNNSLHGQIPTEIGCLFRLRSLHLSYNHLTGEIPANISGCNNLEILSLASNKLQGEFPKALGKLSKQKQLQLFSNKLTGSLFNVIANLTSLEILYVSNNSFIGTIPDSISTMRNLWSLGLASNKFSGILPPTISNLFYLQELFVNDNQLQGKLPMGLGTLPSLNKLVLNSNNLDGPLFNVIANLTSLEILVVSNNAFIGEIPDSISMMRNLRLLNIGFNKLSGSLPLTMSNLSYLQDLTANSNNLLGPLFKAIANLTSLKTISCEYNAFSGIIPDSISRMTNLTSLALTKNNISGMIPPSIFNLSSLEELYLSYNQLSGSIPSHSPFKLFDLRVLGLANNHFYGTIPISLLNVTTLQLIQVEHNRFTGTIQHNFGQFYNLERLQFANNSFVGDISIINTLVNCSKLKVLDLSQNMFTGIIPKLLANLSTNLRELYIDQNPVSGKIPLEIINLINLEILNMGTSGLTGTIPQDFGKLHKLTLVNFSANTLTGQIPDSFGNLSRLSHLFLSDNKLEGKIPLSLGSCANLLDLDLSQNDFNGSLPIEFFGGSKFINLYLSHNRLEGSLPLEISGQFELVQFDVSVNKLSGTIPESFGGLVSLKYLDMHDNFFQGSIPKSFTSLKSLQNVDLSVNNFSGPLPEYFSEIPLLYLNLSYNDFEGKVPTKGVFANASAISLVGNNMLCGGISLLHLQRCVDKERPNKMIKLGVSIMCALVAILALAACIWFYLRTKSEESRSINSAFPIEESFLKVSYKTLLEATDGFSARNLLGSGCFGSVFRGILDENTIAIKVFNLNIRGGSKSFMAECEVLRSIRHRNLVRILTACSSMDFKGNDFKALVYEFMPNGSLDAWLHGGRDLNLLQRLDIAIDVAHALNYLHHECENPIVHCDLKPSNILLDDDLVAHVGDFGLVKVLGQTFHLNQSNSIGVKGTIGYIAPEYGMGGEISAAADLYSYGVLLLELITRKRPTDNMFDEDTNLHMYAKAALPDQVLQIVDSTLLLNEGEEEVMGPTIKGVLQNMVNIGVSCSNALPHMRMSSSIAIRELLHARNALLNIQSTSANFSKEGYDDEDEMALKSAKGFPNFTY